jgi:hypothetical protein
MSANFWIDNEASKECDGKVTQKLTNTVEFPSLRLKASTSGLFVDLGEIINRGIQPERPTVANITADKSLLYAGRLNEIHAEPGVGKTNLSIVLSIETLNKGGTVLFVDPEDTALGILRRLKSFGADMAVVVERFHYLHNPMPEQFGPAIKWALGCAHFLRKASPPVCRSGSSRSNHRSRNKSH